MKRLLPLAASLLATAVAAQTDEPAPAAAPTLARYVRLHETEEGARIALQTASRTLAPVEDGAGPRITLVGVVHIADPAYYAELQRALDAHDVVLFERVEPATRIDADLAGLPAADRARVHCTLRRMRALAAAVAAAPPADLEELAATEAGRALPDHAFRDAWGHQLWYRVGEHGWDLGSLGADGRAGGDGVDRDVRFSELRPLDAEETGETTGLQSDLAAALRCVFQLDAIDYLGARWRRSDMTVDELLDALDETGGSGSASGELLLEALDGDSTLNKLAGGLLRFVGRSETGSAMLKLFGLEVLGRAEELLTSETGPMADLVDVILYDRNEVVVEDLRALTADEPAVRTVAVFYGAGHLGHLEARLRESLDYEFVEGSWHEAIALEVEDAGMTVERARGMRDLISRTLDLQLGR